MAVQSIDLEQVVDKVVSLLEASLPAKIAEINTLKGATDTLICDEPAAYYFGLRILDTVIGESGGPVVEVTTTNIEGLEFNNGLSKEEISIIINLHLWEPDDTFQEIERKTYRYGRALREVMSDEIIRREFFPPSSNIKDSVITGTEFTMLDQIGTTYVKTVTLRLKLIQYLGYTQLI